MSGFLGQFGGSLIQILGAAQGAAGGELASLVAQLENAGLADRVRSWLGHGENLPVTAEELSAAFTPEQLNDWAIQGGTTPEAVLAVLAQQLPAAIDRSAPKTEKEPRV
jgi:uncharacterized protein YidB (DUF937 family)